MHFDTILPPANPEQRMQRRKIRSKSAAQKPPGALRLLALLLMSPIPLMLTACGEDNDPGPGGVSVGEARALDEAAEIIEERRLPQPPSANGENGADGAVGAEGSDGANGANGANGGSDPNGDIDMSRDAH